MYPRLEGSAGENNTISYIKNEIKDLNVPIQTYSFRDMEDNHSFSHIIEVSIKGESPECLVIVVPLNHPQNAPIEEDGAINIGLGIGIIKEFSKRKLPISLKVLFLGAEYGNSSDYPLGSKQFLSTFYPEDSHIFMYLNLKRLPSRLLIRSGGTGIVSPYWYIERIRKALDASGLFYLLKGNENQLYRLSLWDSQPIIDDYLQQGYPAVSIEGAYSDERINVSEWYFSFFSFMDNLIQENKNGFIEEWDKHYLFFQIRTLTLIIPEKTLLILFIIGILIPLSYPFLYTRRFKHYLKSLLRNFWDLPFIFAIIFLFFLAGTILVYMLLYVRNSSVLWEKYPLHFFLIKISIALVLFSFLFGVLKKVPFSKNSTFYTSSALLLLIVNILVLSSWNISLSYYLLWALFFSFIFTLTANKWIKIVNLLLSLVFVVKLLVDIFSVPALQIIDFLLLSPIKGNLIITSNIMPFLLLLIRIDFLFRHRGLKQQKVFVRSFGAAVGSITLGILISLFIIHPYSAANPQPILIREYRNLNTDEMEIHISSEAPFKNLLVGIKELGYPIISGLKDYSTVVYSYDKPLKIDASKKEFLGRENITFSISSTRSVNTVSVSFNISDPIIYDSNFPYTLSPATKSAILHIGKSPPNPLVIELTVPKNDLQVIRLDGELATVPADDQIITGTNIDVTVKKEFSYTFDVRDF